MNDDDRATRFHGWLSEHAPHGAPPGLLPRTLAGLDADASQQTSRWPLLRAAVLVPSFASLLVVALVAAMVMLTLPRGTPPIAEGTASPTETATASEEASAAPSAQPSVAPSPSLAPSDAPTVAPTADPTPVPTPTPTPWPIPQPTPTPPIVGPPGTLTVRVTLDAMPPGTTKVSVSFLDFTGLPTLDPIESPLVLCGGPSGPACDVPGTYEQRFSGFEPHRWVEAAVAAKSNPGGPSLTILRGMWRADGYLVAMTYPLPEGTSGPPQCGGDQWNRSTAHGLVDVDTEWVAPEDLCITFVAWSYAARPPTTGTATVLRDGVSVYVLHMEDWSDVGVIWGGSGEPLVILGQPIPVAKGQRLSLAFTACPACVSEHVNAYLNGALWP